MMIILKPFLNKSRVKEGPTCKRDCIIVSSLKGRQACLDTKDNNWQQDSANLLSYDHGPEMPKCFAVLVAPGVCNHTA